MWTVLLGLGFYNTVDLSYCVALTAGCCFCDSQYLVLLVSSSHSRVQLRSKWYVGILSTMTAFLHPETLCSSCSSQQHKFCLFFFFFATIILLTLIIYFTAVFPAHLTQRLRGALSAEVEIFLDCVLTLRTSVVTSFFILLCQTRNKSFSGISVLSLTRVFEHISYWFFLPDLCFRLCGSLDNTKRFDYLSYPPRTLYQQYFRS